MRLPAFVALAMLIAARLGMGAEQAASPMKAMGWLFLLASAVAFAMLITIIVQKGPK